jgi:hypothetical protein
LREMAGRRKCGGGEVDTEGGKGGLPRGKGGGGGQGREETRGSVVVIFAIKSCLTAASV